MISREGFAQIGTRTLRVDVSPVGAALARVWFADHPTSLVLGLGKAEDYADAPHAIGVIVGPIAGRISHACAPIGDFTARLEANAPPHTLHSGSGGIQHRIWDIVSHSEQQVTLRCDLPEGACGLPGARIVKAHYSVTATDLTLELSTTSDADTLINATSHAYWSLDGTGSLDAHRLQIAGADHLQTDAALCPTGKIIDGRGGEYDFTQPRAPTAGAALDTTFVPFRWPSPSLRRMMTLSSTRSGISLDVDTTEPGVVLYSGENLPTVEHPLNTPPIRPFSALAIETQGWPDSPNHPHFPSILLKSGETMRQITKFSLRMP